jgi:hypothetical protein
VSQPKCHTSRHSTQDISARRSGNSTHSILTMDRSLTAVPTCEDAGRKPPQIRQLWDQFRRPCDDPARWPQQGGCPSPVRAVKHEWASSCEPALRRGTGHSRLTAGHRCPTCTAIAGAILVASMPGEDTSSPGPPPLRGDGRIVTAGVLSKAAGQGRRRAGVLPAFSASSQSRADRHARGTRVSLTVSHSWRAQRFVTATQAGCVAALSLRVSVMLGAGCPALAWMPP